MNWKLLLGLFAAGLVMAVATVYVIPYGVEPMCWVVVFLVGTYLIASGVTHKHFLHGLITGIVISGIAAGTQVLLSTAYLARHQLQVDMYARLYDNTGLTAMQLILISRLTLGILIGLLVGILSLLCSKYFATGEMVPVTENKEEETEPYLPVYQGTDTYQNEYPTLHTTQTNSRQSLVHSLIVLVNPSAKQLEWAQEGRDNENAIVIPNVMNTPIKGLTFDGMHFDLID